MSGDLIRIFDTTLRDGEQSPGCSMNLKEKLGLARQLERLGVDVIEAGFPVASDGAFDSVRAIANELDQVIVCGLARTGKLDIDRAGEAVRCLPDTRVAPQQSIDVVRGAPGFGLEVMNKPLASEVSLGVDNAGRKFDVVLNDGVVHRWASDLDHLEARRTAQHTVTDFWRLEEAVPGVQPHRFALVFVCHVDPAPCAEYHLETDPMEVHVVGNITAIGDEYVRGDEAATPTVGKDVAVAHSGTTNAELVAGPDDRKARH